MKKIILNLVFLVTFTFGVTLEEGREAFRNGEYKMAFTIFEELALEYGLKALREGNYKLAFTLFELLALNDNKRAQATISKMYELGIGVIQDSNKELEWLDKSNLIPYLDNFIMTMYDKDYKKSFLLLKEVANKGDINAKINLGIIYMSHMYTDNSTRIPEFKAKDLFGEACDAGNQVACEFYNRLPTYPPSDMIYPNNRQLFFE